MTTQEREALRERVAEMVRWAATTHTEHRVTVVDAATDRILALLAQPEGEREPYRCARHQQTVGACAGCSPQARADQILHFALVTLNEASRSVAARITEARAVATCEAAFGAAPAVQPTQDAVAPRPEGDLARLRHALTRCAEWFEEYATRHDEKGDRDKATRNWARAHFARNALDAARAVQPAAADQNREG